MSCARCVNGGECTACRRVRQLRDAQLAQLARARAKHEKAVEDAKLWHELGGLPLLRAARLAARFHKVRATPVLRGLQEHYAYQRGRRGIGIGRRPRKCARNRKEAA